MTREGEKNIHLQLKFVEGGLPVLELRTEDMGFKRSLHRCLF